MNAIEVDPIHDSQKVVVSIRDIVKSYTLGGETIEAVRGVSFDLHRGERVVVLGKSGCGKSTLMNLLGGLDHPDGGEILFCNEDIGKMSGRQLAGYRRHKVGMIYQSFNLVPNRSALQNVELPMIFSGIGKRERRQRALQMLEKVDLGNRVMHRPSELSGGQQQRVAIARALVQRPQLLLADEPCGNLDSKTSEQIVALIQEVANECDATTLMVTHDREMAQRFAHRIVTMKDGSLESEASE